MKTTMTLPPAVLRILRTLEAAGHEAYAVGGCVRDSILGRTPGDFDITTSALPEEIKSCFRRTIDTGIQHGTVTVLMRKEPALPQDTDRTMPASPTAETGKPVYEGFEVTTYRIDGEYLDGRHPSRVTFTPSLHEDLARRDFTINAMAYNDRTGLVDDFGGMEDIAGKQIRAVGVPAQRFQEDALRMLRALRFSAQLGFAIEAETYAAVQSLAPNLAQVSKERIQVELTKLLLSHHPEQYRSVFESGLAPFMTAHFSEILQSNAIPAENTGLPQADDNRTATMQRTTSLDAAPSLPDQLPRKKYLRYGALLRNCPDIAKTILRELKLDNDTIRAAQAITLLHQQEIPETPYALRKLLSQYGPERITDWLAMERCLAEDGETITTAVQSAQPREAVPQAAFLRAEAVSAGDAAGLPDVPQAKAAAGLTDTSQPGTAEDRSADEGTRLACICSAERCLTEILNRGDCLSIRELAVNGQDLMALGIEKGPRLGETLNTLLDLVLREPSRNEKELLLTQVKAQ